MGKKIPVPEANLIDVREHVLIVGVTKSGKTTLAREHASILSQAGFRTVVYDPVRTETANANGDWPDDAVIFEEWAKFEDSLKDLQGEPDDPIFVFVDEGSDVFGHNRPENFFIPRRIRHQNVYLRIIAHRPRQLHPSVRTQCTQLYMFRVAKDDARLIAEDYGFSVSEVMPEPLDRGDCVILSAGSAQIEQFNVFRDMLGTDPEPSTTKGKT